MPSLDVRHWDRVSRLFEAVLEQPTEVRTAYVRDADVDDAVRDEVEALLSVADEAAGFFNDLADDVAVPFATSLVQPFELSDSPHGGPESILAEGEDELAPGDRAGRYEILHVLGRGGMGVVYAARDERLGRRVALKMMTTPAGGENSESVHARFVREARAASALDHPHICTIFDAGERDDGRAYIVMASYDGETLHARLRQGRLSLSDALRVTCQVASGLVAAHDADIVHRDLKPANVMLTPSQGVKLLDFGIAKLRTAATLTSSSRVPGTVGYVSPEQIRGDAVDGAADVWALGILLYEMLAGRRPFEGPSPASVLYAILESAPPPLAPLAPDVPKPVARLVEACLRKDPSERPSAADVYRLASDFASGDFADGDASEEGRASAATALPDRSSSDATAVSVTPDVAVDPDTAVASDRRTFWGRPAAWVAVACVVGLAVAILAWTWTRDDDTQYATNDARETVVAVLPFGVQGDSSLNYLREGMVDLLSTQLDGVAGLRVADPNRLLGVVGATDVRDPSRAQALARRVDASQFVVGQVISLGAGFRLSAALYEDTGRPVAQAQAVVADPNELLRGLDRLARDLVAGFFDAPEEKLSGLAAHTSASFPALRAYLRGEQHTRAGRFADAIDAYTNAVTADSAFALAWYRLARAAGWAGDDALNTKALTRAVQHSRDLPGQAQSIIDAYDAYRNGSPRDAERRYRTIIARTPDDAEAWYLFGKTLFHNNPSVGRAASESREAFSRAAMYDPDNRELLVYLMDLALREERWTALDTLTTRYLRPDPGRVALRTPYRLLRALVLESPAQQAAAWEALATAGPDAIHAALVRVGPHLEDLDVSRRLALLLADANHDERWRVEGFVHLGRIEAAKGRWRSAEAAFAAADSLRPGGAVVDRVLSVVASGASDAAVQRVHDDIARQPLGDPVVRAFLLGWMQVRLGHAVPAQTHAANLHALAARHDAPHALWMAVTLDAAIAFQNGDPTAALRHLDAIPPDVPSSNRASSFVLIDPHVRLLRADACASAGRADDALRWYAAAYDDMHHGATSARATSTLQRAALYVDLGQTTEAVAAYRRVIDLWSDADPAFAFAVDATRDRVNALLLHSTDLDRSP